MKTNILIPTELIVKHQKKMGRRWLLGLIAAMPVMIFTGCTEENITPRYETETTARISSEGADEGNNAVLKTTVTVEFAECLPSYWPGKLLRLTSSPEYAGIYLQPFECASNENPQFGQKYEVTYRKMVDDGRFIEEDEVVCLGVPGDMDQNYPARIISMKLIE